MVGIDTLGVNQQRRSSGSNDVMGGRGYIPGTPTRSSSIMGGRGYIPGQTATRSTRSTSASSPVTETRAERNARRGGGGGEIDWRDASYNAQIAAINRALRDFETGLQTRGTRYGQDYMRGLGDLGFRAGEGFIAAPDILKFQNLEEGLQAVRRPQIAQRMGAATEELPGGVTPPTPASQMMGGQWDYEGEFNPFSSATRGTRTARDEFAGRGMLRSSDFAQSYAQFQDQLNQQLESMETGRGRFFEDALTNLAQQRATADERRQAAQRDAIMRAAMMSMGR